MSELTERLRKVEMYGDFVEGKGWSRAYPSRIQIEAADALEAQEALLKGVVDDLYAAMDCLEWGDIKRLHERLSKALTPSLPK